jgi:hypothetical protein
VLARCREASKAEAAAELVVAPGTVKTHVAGVLALSGVTNLPILGSVVGAGWG